MICFELFSASLSYFSKGPSTLSASLAVQGHLGESSEPVGSLGVAGGGIGLEEAGAVAGGRWSWE